MRRNLAARMGVWSAHHRRTAIIGWLLFVVLATAAGGASGMVEMSASEQGTGDSARAQKILDDAGLDQPAGELVLVSSGTAGGWKAAAAELSEAIGKTGEAQKIEPPLASQNGREALIRFQIKGDSKTAADRVQPVLDAVRDTGKAQQGVEIHQFGQASSEKWLGDLLSEDFQRAEFTAVPLALGILLVAFGAVVAALLPVGLALTACMAAFGLLSLASHQLHLFQTTYSVMFLMGLAVGVDYCLFYLRRERDERAAGHDAETALRIAAATSGRAVLVSGVTVMLAMAGMFLSGLMLFKGFALATIIVVFIAMLGSVTVLPALLAWLGDRIDAGRIPFLNRRGKKGAHESGAVAGAVLRPVLAKPKLFAFGAVAVLLVLAAPALGMKTESLGMEKQFGSDASLSVAYKKVTEAFPGGPEPARVVVKADDIDSERMRGALARFDPSDVTVHQAKNVAEIEVVLAGNGNDSRSKDALADLRDKRVPAAFGGTGAQVFVGGELAESVDFNDQLKRGIVPVFAFITAVTFLLMLFCFRSYVIAVTSILLNLLSVAAAYGVMVAVFQHGWGASALGTEAVGAIEGWMPLFVLVVLFGLSMDYHVFVVSRIREARDRGTDTRAAINEGIRRTAGAVTGAAAIMVAVFAVFGTLSMQDMQQMGVGLAAAVLLDATIVRMVLLPSVMALLGERNWRTPRGLGWLPRMDHGEAEVPTPGGRHVAPVGAGR
ncbi:MMPL family transporter [Streptomyces lunaelactis]|uniref:MMPL family transporter n=1 Tax=Streptomyces lunaelactis TaxID=1535768 RepID=UPI001585180F|nr:MMPL family transporter [Streptomyces lunaelactis]NUK54645.1 MMPL family transporter [Streptomyces lunaelactis]NUK68349.1 MMPL family transporter [Streptomyces lunaelactis]NUK75156.1 MMPL family transporter [Streptomyces lunaelactis]NUK79177.1 MMPL family transporter [Streptomyces lunaelactis]